MSTSALGTTLTAIQAGLDALTALSGVNVFSVPVSQEDGGLECVWLDDATFNEEEAAMGGSRMEAWDIPGEVWAKTQEWKGSLESTGQAARNRVLTLFAAIETYINDTYVSSYPHVTITAGTLRYGRTDGGYGCAMSFTLQMRNIKNP